MSGGLEQITERMARYLNGKGVRAVTAWPGEARKQLPEPVAAVSLRGCQAGPAGFQDYLGERYNEEAGNWEELYGRRTKLTFGLDLYAEAELGDGEMQAAFDRLAGALQQEGPQGLKVLELSCGETGWDRSGRLLKRPVEAVCQAYLYAVTEPGGVFLDFEIRGGMDP